MLEKFPLLPQVRVQRHGIDTAALDAPAPSPYDKSWEANCVFVGANRLDRDAVARAAGLFPRWAMHIIGPFADVPRGQNIFTYGEMKFEQTMPYIKNAQIGLHTLEYEPGAQCFTDSLKVMQYTWCHLPIVAPEFLRSRRKHTFYYQPGDDESIRRAFLDASACDRSKIDRDEVTSWDALARKLAGEEA